MVICVLFCLHKIYNTHSSVFLMHSSKLRISYIKAITRNVRYLCTVKQIITTVSYYNFFYWKLSILYKKTPLYNKTSGKSILVNQVLHVYPHGKHLGFRFKD